MFIFEDVPWLRVFVSWAVAASVVWLCLAIPAYVVARGLAHFRERLTRWQALMRESAVERRRVQAEHLHRARVDVLQASRLETVDSEALAEWHTRIEKALGVLVSLTKEATGLLNSSRGHVETVRSSLDTLSAIDDQWRAHAGESSGTPLQARAVERPKSWIRVVGSLLFLVPILGANWILSSVVFRELVPNVQTVLGASLPLSVVIAALIVFLEAAAGFLSGALGQREAGDHRQLSLWQMASIGLGLAMIAVETIFYSMFAADSTADTLNLFGMSVAVSHGFGLIGLVLGGSLFALSHLATTGSFSIAADRGLTRLLRQLKQLKTQGAAWQRLVTTMSGAHTNAQKILGEVDRVFDSLNAKGFQALAELTTLLERERHSPPEWTRSSPRALSEGESRARFAETPLYVAIAGLGTLVTLTLLALSLSAHRDLSGWASVAAAAGAALVPIALGHEAGLRSRAGSLAASHSPSFWRGLPTGVLTGVCACTAWVLASHGFLPRQSALLADFALVPSVATFLAERRNAQFPGFLRPVLLGWAYAMSNCVVAALRALVAISAVVLGLAAGLLQVLAAPVDLLMSRWARRPEPVA